MPTSDVDNSEDASVDCRATLGNEFLKGASAEIMDRLRDITSSNRDWDFEERLAKIRSDQVFEAERIRLRNIQAKIRAKEEKRQLELQAQRDGEAAQRSESLKKETWPKYRAQGMDWKSF